MYEAVLSQKLADLFHRNVMAVGILGFYQNYVHDAINLSIEDSAYDGFGFVKCHVNIRFCWTDSWIDDAGNYKGISAEV